MLTVESLLNFLKRCPLDNEIILDNGDDIKHLEVGYSNKIIISHEVPKHWCNKCGGNVFTKETEKTKYYCPICDKNLTESEVEEKNYE